MPERVPDPADTPLPRAYSALLGEAADVAAKAVDRIHDLRDQYPGDVPAHLVEQLDRARADPAAERRGMLRLPGGPDPILVGLGDGTTVEAAVVDRSPGGLSLRVGALLLPGAAISVR